MSLHKRGDVWHWRRMVDGVPLARSCKTGDEQQAKKLAAKWDHEAIQQIRVEGLRPILLHDAIEGFLKDRKGTNGYGSAVNHMKPWRKLPNKLVKEIQLHEVKTLLADQKASKAHNTLCVAVMYWNALMNWCTDKRLTSGPKLPPMKSESTRMRLVSLEEEEALYRATDPDAKYRGKSAGHTAARQDNQDILVCLLHLGARITEVEMLPWTAVDFEANTVYVRRLKRGNPCLLMMTTRLRAVMQRRFATKTDEWVFSQKATHNTSTQWLDRAIERAGIDETQGKITSHTFRHTAATRLLRAGMDIVEVQKYLGHKNIASTLVYLHAIPSEVAKRAAAVFDAA
jgi:integrase